MPVTLRMPKLFGGGNAEPALSQDTAQLVQQLHGSNYEACLAGQVFSQTTTPLGLAIPIYTGTAITGGLPIWNPTGSGVNVVPIRFATAKASGTSAFFGVGMAFKGGVGADLATGSHITAFAATTPKNGMLGAGNTSRVKSSNAGTCTATALAAGDAFLSFGCGTGVAADATTSDLVTHIYDFDGMVIIPPGTLAYVVATKAGVALHFSSITWKELPI